jgi:hypothetical protein
MKIDDLIQKLLEIKEEKGNLEVEVATVRSTFNLYRQDGFTAIPITFVTQSFCRMGEDRDPEKDIQFVTIIGVKAKKSE